MVKDVVEARDWEARDHSDSPSYQQRIPCGPLLSNEAFRQEICDDQGKAFYITGYRFATVKILEELRSTL